MSRLGFIKCKVYHGDVYLGELENLPAKNQQHFQFPNNEIRISHLSMSSERCIPLSILQTISPFSIRCKLESATQPTPPLPNSINNEQPPLTRLHYSCFHELKTAVVVIGDEEIHLVAMPSKQEKFPCFWCFSVPLGLYGYCVGMLNLRCLAIVFDLDETLIVANTMKSFEDKIEALQRRISCETDLFRVQGMTAEIKRYIDDKLLLKQYLEGDTVIDNGKLLKAQPEEVPPLSNSHDRVVRPVIRLPDRNTVLTRINPEVRDTSVLVRLRPAWEDLRSYLTAKGRKRFEVYVCTMAEKDYALEMWRLLDPEAHLINHKQILDRVVCVKSDSKKSLLNVFWNRICHPKMAMVIDDRLKVWEDKDQPRVHVVPAFTPYYAPQAETANAVPVLCVARNVACNVRAGFFKEFDENLLRKISEICYEDEVANLPYPPDVSDFMMSEDAGFIPNGNRDAPITEGMTGAEVEQKLKQHDDKKMVDSAAPFVGNNHDLRPHISQQPVTVSHDVTWPTAPRTLVPLQNPGLLGVSVRREVNPSELYPELGRRIPTMPHGQDMREFGLGDSSNLSRSLVQVAVPSVQGRGGWLVEEDPNVGPGNQTLRQLQDAGASNPDKQRGYHRSVENNFPSGTLPSLPQVKNEQEFLGHKRQKLNDQLSNQSLPSEHNGINGNQVSITTRENETGKVFPPSMSIGVLQEIGRRCGTKVEYKFDTSTSKDLQLFVEVLFGGEKIGVGKGKTRKDAQQQAAENALRSLADKYVAHIAPESGAMQKDMDKLSLVKENGFIWDIVDPAKDELSKEVALPNLSTSRSPFMV